jgi:hypothetical protein
VRVNCEWVREDGVLGRIEEKAKGWLRAKYFCSHSLACKERWLSIAMHCCPRCCNWRPQNHRNQASKGDACHRSVARLPACLTTHPQPAYPPA